MLLAQALGEYAGMGALLDGVTGMSVRLEEFAGEWGTEGLVILLAAVIVWRVVTAVR
jgi:hypothetical protein